MDSVTKIIAEYASRSAFEHLTEHSLPYIFARTLADGPIKITSFADDAVRDQRLRPLMSKIKVIPDDRIEALLPQKTFMRVVATTLDGRQHVVEVSNPLGHPDNPMQDRHIEEKFISLVEPALGKARCGAALEIWWCLDQAVGVSAAMQLLEIDR